MKKIIVIVGPTAVGKTALSIALAQHYQGEIINADSTQVYKNLDIATAKVTEEEAEGIKHHLLDIKELDEVYTVYDYQKDCREKIKELQDKDITPILVGGTGLYIKAALYDYEFKEEKVKQDYSEYSNEELYKLLIGLDQNTTIHQNNRKRIERALDYAIENRSSISNKPKSEELLYDVIFVGLTTDRETLYNRINKRVEVMITNGMLEEAKKIFDLNQRTKAILTPIGYKELFPYFENNDTLENCLEKIKQNSRHYAKRQYTWFNNQMNITWFNTNFSDFNETIDKIIKYIDSI